MGNRRNGYGKRRLELAVLLLSVLIGAWGTAAYGAKAGYGVKAGYGGQELSFRHTEQAAWWGGLYPEYCLPPALEQRDGKAVSRSEAGFGEKSAGGEEQVSVQIQFKYLKFLNELGGTDE